MIDKIDTTQPRGVTLLLVMLILSIVSSVALAVTFLIVRQFEQGIDVRKAIEAQDIADTGVEKILYEVKSGRTGSASAFIADLKADYVCDDPLNQGILDNGEFCVDQDASFEYENELQTSLKENEVVTLDLYDPSDPAGEEVTAIELSGSADPDTWIEVSWIGWTVQDGSFSYIASTTKEYFRASEINPSRKTFFKKSYDEISGTSVYFLNNPFVTGTTDVGQCVSDPLINDGCLVTTSTNPINYIVRIKALFGDVPDLGVIAYTDCVADELCAAPTSIALPARVAVKVIGRTDKVLQAVQLSIPWKYSLAGLYDYALLAEGGLSKTVSVNPGFYSSGAIQAEQGIGAASYSASATPNTPPHTPFECVGADNACAGSGWTSENPNSSIESATRNARCQLEPDLDASGGATCGFDNADGRIAYDLSSYDLGDEPLVGIVRTRRSYYLNYRVRVTSESANEAMTTYICNSTDVCTKVQSEIDEGRNIYGVSGTAETDKSTDGWLTCSSLIYASSDDTLQFRANPNWTDSNDEWTPRLDWFNISTIAFAGQNNCTFSPWTFARDSYTFEATAHMAENEECSLGTCNSTVNWFGYHRLALPGFSPQFECKEASNYCSMKIGTAIAYGAEAGFTYPLQYEISSGVYSPKIAEGDYYVTVKASNLNIGSGTGGQKDNFIFDIGNFDNNDLWGAWSYGTVYLPTTNYLNMYRAQGAYNSSLGDGTNGCVVPKQMRVLSGNAASISLSDSNSSGEPSLTFNSFTLSHTYPKDVSGNALPLCTMLSGTPTVQFVQPLQGGFFNPIFSGGNPNYIKVNAEAAQGYTNIDYVELRAIKQSDGTETLIGVDNDGVNPYEFEWPHDASWIPILPDGLYTFKAVAVDANGLATYPPATITNVTIDNVEPTVGASYPFNENAGVVSTTVTATDLAGLANSGISYVILYSHAEDRTVGSCTSPTYQTSFSCVISFVPTVTPWDEQRFEVIATDRAGNNTSVSYYSDTAPPMVDPFTVTMSGAQATATIHVTDTNPLGAGAIKEITLYSKAEEADVGSCVYSTPYDDEQTCVITYTPTQPISVNYFRVIARDVSGNSGAWVYDPDTTKPTISWFSHTLGDLYNSPSGNLTTLQANVQDTGSGLDYVRMFSYVLSGSTRENYTPLGECEYDGEITLQVCTVPWNITSSGWPDGGNYYLEVQVKDRRGLVFSQSWGAKTMH